MNIRSVVSALAMVAATRVATAQSITIADRDRIEAEVRTVFESELVAAREGNVESVAATWSAEDGICVWQGVIESCHHVLASYRNAWSSSAVERPLRQEREGTMVRVFVLSATVALVATATSVNRSFLANGDVSTARFGGLFVYVLENGSWRFHSGAQSAWAIDTLNGR